MDTLCQGDTEGYEVVAAGACWPGVLVAWFAAHLGGSFVLVVPAAVAKRRLPRPEGRKPDRAGDPVASGAIAAAG